MLCNNCGTQTTEGATFCQKCGANLMGDNSARQTTVKSNSTEIQKSFEPPLQTSHLPVNPKKKSAGKIILIIVISVVAVPVLLMIIGAIMMLNGYESGATQVNVTSDASSSSTKEVSAVSATSETSTASVSSSLEITEDTAKQLVGEWLVKNPLEGVVTYFQFIVPSGGKNYYWGLLKN